MHIKATKPPEISVRFGKSFIVWFAISNTWVRLEKPVNYLLRKTYRSFESSVLIKKLSKKFSFDPDQAEKILSDFLQLKKKLYEPAPSTDLNSVSAPELLNPDSIPFAIYTYKYGNFTFSISYSDRDAEYYVHPLFDHLCEENISQSLSDFMISSRKNEHVLRSFSETQAFAFETMSALKKHLLLSILEKKYKLNKDDWLATVHASAVCNGKRTILFCSSSGSGKSTLAFLLQKKGYEFIADDFVAIHGKRGFAFSIPTGISVKNEGLSYISTILESDKDYALKSYGNKAAHYIYPKKVNAELVHPHTCREIIFISYDSSVDMNVKTLDTDEALQNFLQHSKTSPITANAKRFIKWFMKVECKQISYGNTDRILQEIDALFNEN